MKNEEPKRLGAMPVYDYHLERARREAERNRKEQETMGWTFRIMVALFFATWIFFAMFAVMTWPTPTGP